MGKSKEIALKCGVCGNLNFEYDEELYESIEEADLLKCTVCNKTYTPEGLREVNSILINNEAEELVKEELKRLGFTFSKK